MMRQWLKQLFGGRTQATHTAPAAVSGSRTDDRTDDRAGDDHTNPNHMIDDHTIFVVSGLPRSGTSMMMKMLEAGGLSVLIDGLRAADKDNPEGYYELEQVKGIDKGDAGWLPDAVGKGVKVISALLEHLPPDYTYHVIFMHRHIEEVLRSQRKMLQHRGEDKDAINDAQIADLFTKHVANTLTWVNKQPNFRLLEVHYNEMLQDPQPHARAINQFLGNRLDERAMCDVVNPDLYRNRTNNPTDTPIDSTAGNRTTWS